MKKHFKEAKESIRKGIESTKRLAALEIMTNNCLGLIAVMRTTGCISQTETDQLVSYTINLFTVQRSKVFDETKYEYVE